MKTIKEINNILSHSKKEIVEKYKLKKLGIFGSYVRGEQTEESDIDILVEFEEDYKTFDNYMDLKFYFEDLFSTNVDLLIESAIKPRLRHIILNEVKYA
ncbi:Nucleotidyltransferase domain protein [uncultured archaeon]|nr:Nucleotidyltransferase domain protein [uncultured archaeon]